MMTRKNLVLAVVLALATLSWITMAAATGTAHHPPQRPGQAECGATIVLADQLVVVAGCRVRFAGAATAASETRRLA